MAGVVSLDLDGTMAFGDPAGPLSPSLVTGLQARGYLVGSCSDRTRLEQLTLWRDAALEPAFVCHKPDLSELRRAWSSPTFLHVGDTDVDAHFARRAGFDFLHVHETDVAAALRSVVEHGRGLGQLADGRRRAVRVPERANDDARGGPRWMTSSRCSAGSRTR